MPQAGDTRSSLQGLLVVDKPLGWTSTQVVRHVRRAAGGAKTGHAGTLDPLATGVVICCIGRATKQVENLMGLTKVYDAQIDLSANTETDDREGEPVPVDVPNPPSAGQLVYALRLFVGHIQQTPPAYSAIHVGGQRAYKLARKGKIPALQPRQVRVDAIDLIEYHWPLATVKITCGRGTYIRSIARDLGQALGTGGHLAALRRLAVGPYNISVATSIKNLDGPLNLNDLIDPHRYPRDRKG